MIIESDKSLLELNTFRIDSSAKYFAEFTTVGQLHEIISERKLKNNKKLVLGGGSNLLLTKNFDGLVVKNSLRGIQTIKEDAHHVWIKTAAGEVWHEFVMFCVERNLAGVENLSLIPGYVGAAPIQNIGAYGEELKNVFHSLTVIDLSSGEQKVFSADEPVC
jgi:UDP-N-acetylmuramate dehydrogenase